MDYKVVTAIPFVEVGIGDILEVHARRGVVNDMSNISVCKEKLEVVRKVRTTANREVVLLVLGYDKLADILWKDCTLDKNLRLGNHAAGSLSLIERIHRINVRRNRKRKDCDIILP